MRDAGRTRLSRGWERTTLPGMQMCVASFGGLPQGSLAGVLAHALKAAAAVSTVRKDAAAWKRSSLETRSPRMLLPARKAKWLAKGGARRTACVDEVMHQWGSVTALREV